MRRRQPILALCSAVALGAAMFAIAACSSGDVSQSNYDKVKQQLQDQQTQNQQLQQQLANAPKAGATTTGAAAAATTATASGTPIMWLLGALQVPKATPPPSPTATPPGYVAPPKPTAPASVYEAVPFTFYVETLATTHQSNFNIAANVACSPSGLFVRGQRIVWRFEVFDTSTGKRVTDKDGAKLKVVLPNGDEANGSWSQRGGGQAPDAPFMWSSNWDIPQDFPLGAVDYKIVITTKDGKTFTWAPPALVAKNLNEDTRPKVMQ